MLLSFLPQFKVLGSNIMVREASFKVWLVRGGELVAISVLSKR